MKQLETDSYGSVYLNPEIEEYQIQFLNYSKASTENTVKMCEVLHKAKKEFWEKTKEDSSFSRLCTRLGYDNGSSDSTIKKYLVIGSNAERFRPYLDRLPNTWTTLYEITQLNEDLFNTAIEDGRLNVKTLAKEVLALRKSTPELAEELPVLRLKIHNNINDGSLHKLLKKLEALKITYPFEIEKNSRASLLLSHLESKQ